MHSCVEHIWKLTGIVVYLSHNYSPAPDALMQLLYNDLSPMENHHLAAAFGIMRQPGNNFMDHLPRKVSCRRAGAGEGAS